MKKSLIVFIVAFGLSIALTFLPLVPKTVVSQSSIAGSISVNTLFSLFFGLVGLALFFAVFYFLANNNKIPVSKSTIIALLLGVTIGSAIVYLLNVFLYQSYVGLYLSMAVNSSVSGVFQFFFPALTALMYAELRETRNQTIISA
ncbi:MAG: hypothetical protein ACM3UL_01490 [Ignavibacteria bacterium]